MIVLDTHIWIWWVHDDAQLPPRHRDPADQIIVATARLYGCPLVTLDRAIRAYPHAQVAPSHGEGQA